MTLEVTALTRELTSFTIYPSKLWPSTSSRTNHIFFDLEMSKVIVWVRAFSRLSSLKSISPDRPNVTRMCE